MTEKKRFIAVIALIALFFALISSFGFIIIEANHDCTGENCRICYRITVLENTLKSMIYVVSVSVFCALEKFSTVVCFEYRDNHNRDNSLVSLKVKLSN